MFACWIVGWCDNWVTNINRCCSIVSIVIFIIILLPCHVIGFQNPNGIICQIVVRHCLCRCFNIIWRCIGKSSPTRHLPIGTINHRHCDCRSKSHKTARVTICEFSAIRIPFKVMLMYLPNCIVCQISIWHNRSWCYCRCSISRCVPTFECVAYPVGCCCWSYCCTIINCTISSFCSKHTTIGIPCNGVGVNLPNGVVRQSIIRHFSHHFSWSSVRCCCPTFKSVTCAGRSIWFFNGRTIINHTVCIITSQNITTICVPRKLVRVYLPNGIERNSSYFHITIIIIGYYTAVGGI